MPSDEIQKHTLNLWAGDYERVQALFPDIGAAPVIRAWVRKLIEQCENGETPMPNVEIEL